MPPARPSAPSSASQLAPLDKPAPPASVVQSPSEQTTDLHDTVARCVELINKAPAKATYSRDEVAELLHHCGQPNIVPARITPKPTAP